MVYGIFILIFVGLGLVMNHTFRQTENWHSRR